MIIPPATSSRGGFHDDGARRAAWTPPIPTAAKNRRMRILMATIQSSTSPTMRALSRLMPAMPATAPLMRMCFHRGRAACAKKVEP